MNKEDIIAQSKAAYGQWCVQWREHARIHSALPMKDIKDFENSGIGKAALCVANGYTFEENIETIKKYKDNVDIICCDKTLGHLLDNGIIPKICIVCDANVDYKRYMEPWKDKLQDTILFINVCGNPEWTSNGNWKDKYFFINKDVIDSQLEFSKISGCKNFIPAGTNVSNAMVIMLTQSENNARRNFFGYDKILLIGYDYSWRHGGKYYAFNQDGDKKNQYMKHLYCLTANFEFAYTSGNLAFSCQWLHDYANAFKLPLIQCTKSSILSLKTGSLEEQMQYRFKPEDSEIVKKHVEALRALQEQKKNIERELKRIDREHWTSFLASA